LQNAQKLDDVREALRRGDLNAAAQLAQIYQLTPVAVRIAFSRVARTLRFKVRGISWPANTKAADLGKAGPRYLKFSSARTGSIGAPQFTA
jgi:hypothetical protein